MRDITLILSGNDHRAVDSAVRRVMSVVTETGHRARGPIPLARTQESASIRQIDIVAASHTLGPALAQADLPLAVSVEIRT